MFALLGRAWIRKEVKAVAAVGLLFQEPGQIVVGERPVARWRHFRCAVRVREETQSLRGAVVDAADLRRKSVSPRDRAS